MWTIWTFFCVIINTFLKLDKARKTGRDFFEGIEGAVLKHAQVY